MLRIIKAQYKYTTAAIIRRPLYGVPPRGRHTERWLYISCLGVDDETNSPNQHRCCSGILHRGGVFGRIHQRRDVDVHSRITGVQSGF